MTIKIEIEAHPDRGDMGQQVERAMSALGFYRSAPVVSSVSQTADAPVYKHTEVAYRDGEITSTVQDEAPAATEEAVQDFVHRDEEPKGGQYPYVIDYRTVGSASEGKARRTKDQIADDAEFEKLAAEKGVSLEKLNKAIAEQGRDDAKAFLVQYQPTATVATQEEPKAAISTGEERIGPDDVQDAADEAAETEKTGLAPIDVLRRLVGDYQKKHGMPAAVKLCQEGGLIGKPIHELDDAGIEAAIAAMQGGVTQIRYFYHPESESLFTATDDSPLSDGLVEEIDFATYTKLKIAAAEEPASLEPKTKADLVEAMMRYADKYDGTRDQAKMFHTLADMPRVFVETFGKGVDKLSKVPEDKYAEAVAAVEAAIEADPYGRAK